MHAFANPISWGMKLFFPQLAASSFRPDAYACFPWGGDDDDGGGAAQAAE
jgi:hypothetical protein